MDLRAEKSRQDMRREKGRYVWPHHTGSVGSNGPPTRQQRRAVERRMRKERRKLVNATAASLRAERDE